MIFVTGGTGLLGAHLLFDLVSKDNKVRALKRESSNIEAVKKVFGYYSNDSTLFDKIEWVEGNTLDIVSLDEALQAVKTVYHCAAVVSFNPKERDEMMKINIEGTANVVNACLHAGVEKLCHVSSTAALGKKQSGELISEETEWDNKNASYYSKSKYWSEQEVWRGKEEGLNIVVVNPSIIIGPGKWGRSSTNVFTEVWKGLKYYTLGVNAFVDVKDVSKCMLQLMDSKTKNEQYLIVSENLSFKDLFIQIALALGKSEPFIRANALLTGIAWRANKLMSYGGMRIVLTNETAQSSQSISRYSNDKIKKELGIDFIPVEKSIRETAILFLQQFSS